MILIAPPSSREADCACRVSLLACHPGAQYRVVVEGISSFFSSDLYSGSPALAVREVRRSDIRIYHFVFKISQ